MEAEEEEFLIKPKVDTAISPKIKISSNVFDTVKSNEAGKDGKDSKEDESDEKKKSVLGNLFGVLLNNYFYR